MTIVLIQEKVSIAQALAIKHGLSFWMRTKRPINRLYTPKNLLRTAGNITGKSYKMGQYEQAISDLHFWLEAQV